jgi:hypothetical protein
MMQMLVKTTLGAFALLMLAGGASAEPADTVVPDRLVIGFEGEGKVDGSPQACLAFVKEMTEWDKAATEKGAKQVCAGRKRYLDAYAALEANYKNFVKAFSVDRRLNLPEAVSSFKTLVKACMDHKFGLTAGAHNIRNDILENDIRSACLTLGSNLIKDETVKFNAALRR